MTTRSMKPLDLSFLLNESRDTPQHVAGVTVFENPRADAGWTIADLVQHYRAAKPVAPFDAVPQLRRLGPPRWQVVRDFDMRYHVQHVALPAPGNDAQLDELVQQWHSESLDMHRPLFQMTVIEGLERHRFAIYMKVHHSIADGTSAIQRLLASVDKDPAAPLRTPLFAVQAGGADRRRAPPGLAGQLKSAFAGLKDQAVSASQLTGEFWHRVQAETARVPVEGSAPFGAAATLLNEPLRYGRTFAHLSLPMAPLRAAAKAADGTLNDVMLAVVDAAAARYLADRGQAAGEPLHALVPVSLHEEGTTEDGNAITGIICALGDADADAHQRLKQIIARMHAGKARIRRLTKTAASNYFTGLFLIAQGLGAAGVRRPVANLVVSNMSATAVDRYLGGSRMVGLYPVNVLAVGMGLSVTLVSRAGQLDIGIIANRNAVPDAQRVAEFMRDAFHALTDEAGAERQAAAAARKKTAARKAPADRKVSITAAKTAPRKTAAAKVATRKRAERKTVEA